MTRRWPAPSPLVRVGVLVASGLLLAGIALWAGSVGPWIGRPRSDSPREAPTFAPPTIHPPPVRPVDPPPAASTGSSFDPTIVLLVLGGILLVGLMVIAVILIRNRVPAAPRRTPVVPPSDEVRPAPVAPDQARPFDTRRAADYVIARWDHVEQVARGRGSGRRPEQTPTEFMDALKATYPLDDGAAAELLTLYQRARFDHVMLRPDTAARAGAAAEHLLGALLLARQELR